MDDLFLKYSGADLYTEAFNETLASYDKQFKESINAINTQATVAEADALKQSGEFVSSMGTGASAILQENINQTIETQRESAIASSIEAYNKNISAIQTEFSKQLTEIFGKVTADGRFESAIDFASKAIQANNSLLKMLAINHSEIFGEDMGDDYMAYLESKGYIERGLGVYSITDSGYEYIDSIINSQAFDFGQDTEFNKLVDTIIDDIYGAEFNVLEEDEQTEIRTEWGNWLRNNSDTWRYAGLGLINDDGAVDNFWTSGDAGEIDISVDTIFGDNYTFTFNGNVGATWSEGDNITLSNNSADSIARVEIDREVKHLLNTQGVQKLKDGTVFKHNGSTYVKTNGSVYKIRVNPWTKPEHARMLNI